MSRCRRDEFSVKTSAHLAAARKSMSICLVGWSYSITSIIDLECHSGAVARVVVSIDMDSTFFDFFRSFF